MRLAAVLLLGCLFVASAAFPQTSAPPSQAQTILPVDYFTRYDEVGELKLSPNGEFVAASAGKAGMYSLVVIQIKDKKIVGGLRMPPDRTVAEINWVSDDRLIYMTGVRHHGE